MPNRRVTAKAAAISAAALLAAAAAACGDDDPDAEDAADLGGSWTANLTTTAEWAAVYPNGHGTVNATSDDGTNVQLTAVGLGDSVEYTAHVHDGECDDNPPGGGHWLSDPNGEDAAGNIVELTFTTSATGVGETTESSTLALDDRAESVVVHAPDAVVQAQGLTGDRVLCGDLED
ncbi:Copper/zinc superoxide dismutase (SODC) [Glycomyces sambucus]|uniref:Copper/zinc superoxide dismutase (SODC) n=1 Tax=Glycomyces sambucus TaxID=380244 RepID=A0A1G9DRV9_9ACTN|nr:hypothetical protein [Glycomyces sambucus]SDK66576.1 Copper/zinc superoxide dismutase (SODC) [Glycomyces sambucus]